MLLLSTLALVASLQAPQDFRWSGVVDAGKTIEIKGVNGEIRATAASGNTVEVFAAKHSRRSDLASVELRVVKSDAGVMICAIYPSRRGKNECGSGEGGQNSDNNDVVVDFTVKVPAGVRFVGRTVNGGVTAAGLHGDAEGRTVNGNVSVETSGRADGSTVNGDVKVEMGRISGSAAMTYGTVNGGIEITIPAGASFEVKASTVNGDIETEFPLTVTGRFGPRHLSGTIGGGGRVLSLTTVNGNIKIKKGS